MLKHARAPAETLDEYKLRDELRALRAKIPDRPAMNPIINVAFDLSRELESGRVSFEELRALAGRLMDRACVRRARPARTHRLYRSLRDDRRVLELRGRDGDLGGRQRGGVRGVQGALVAGAHGRRADGAPHVRPLRAAVAAHDRDRHVRALDGQRARRPPAPARRSHRPRLRARPRAARDRQPAIGLRRAAEQLLRHGRGPLRREARTASSRSSPPSPPGSATTSTGAPTSSGATRSCCG